MESSEHSMQLLSMFTHPVFLVKDGIIIAANKGAEDLQICENTSVFDILLSGQDAYREMTSGSLSLTVGIGPVSTVAAVVRMGDMDYFHLNCAGENSDLRVLALASQHLRDPLTNIIALADGLISQQSENLSARDKLRIAQFNQNLHRLLRSVGNMSDTYSCTERMHSMEQSNISAVVSDAVEKAQHLLSESSVKLAFTADSNSVTGLIDRNLLERAIYNMLSNAIRYADPGSKVQAAFHSSKNMVHFTVENDCKDFSANLLGTIFFRYRRSPSITDGKSGLGLGIPMIQAIASVHKGSLLVTIPESGKVRFCLSVPVRQDQNGVLRSPVLRPDYAGGHDHSLVELSDVLPDKAYE